MTPELATAICTGIVSIIAAMGALAASIHNGWKLTKNNDKSDKQLQEIHVLVNSRLSDAIAQIKSLHAQVLSLGATPIVQVPSSSNTGMQ
jgi:hypothetical protein